MAGFIMYRNNLFSIVLKTSLTSSLLVSEWYTKILGKYNRPAIHDITAIRWSALKVKYEFILPNIFLPSVQVGQYDLYHRLDMAQHQNSFHHCLKNFPCPV